MKRILAVAAVACILVLAGCSADDREPAAEETTPQEAPSQEAPTQEPTPSQEPTPTPEPEATCADTSADQALDVAMPLMPRPFPPEQEYMADRNWTTTGADLEGYDPCAPLSWITFSVENGTGSSPSQVALFHNGEFVQAATEKSYGFWPRVTRLSADEIRIVYRWPKPNEGNAEASGESPMTFTWNDDTASIAVEGDPPSYL